ncbi:S8 family serine peptidase [Kribbella lupini]|uniref:Type VII secretion-associated serine protease mycosin n=1 Tax=Kribbella lupini TaxID=291602 RepID=A0ABN1ZYP9_9ACTN
MPAALVAATLVTVTGSSVGAEQFKPYVVKSVAGRTAESAAASNAALVKFRSGASKAARAQALGKAGGRAGASIGGDVVRVTGDRPATELVKKLKAEPAVQLASLDYIRKISATPNDAYYGGYQTYLSTVRLPQAWDLTKSAGTQTVAVLDTGIDAGHPDLVGRVLAGRNEITPGAAPNDDNGHGTMTSGIVGANTNNGVGVAGAAWSTKILPVKVLDWEGNGPDSAIIAGINWAAAQGARVINMSLGGDGDNPVLHDAISQAVAKGVVVVAAAGNTGIESPSYPAAYPEVLAVAATDNNAALTGFSTRGDWVDLAAPGWNIASTGPRSLTEPGYDPYWIGSGTSFSAPIVAGVAALLRNKYPSYTPAQVMARLKTTARDAGPRGIDPFYGAGVLDAYNALGGSWAPEFWGAGPDGNDLASRATPMTTSASGVIGPEGDVDWYKVTEPSDRVGRVTVTGPVYDGENRAQNFAPVVSVHSNSILQVLSRAQADTEPETPQQLSVSVNVNFVAGDNYIAVRNYNGSRDSRPYTVTVGAGTQVTNTSDYYWIRDAAPADFAGGVARTATPTVTFVRDLIPGSVTNSTVRLLNGKTGNAVPAAVAYDEATRTAKVTPNAPLQDNTPYRLSVGAVQDSVTTENYTGGFSSVFRTVDENPAPASGFDATGAYTTAALKWSFPAITDLDQVVVRRAIGTTAPASPTAGTAVYNGEASTATATGLANATSYAFSAFVKDRSGRFSAPVTTQLTGTATSMASTASVINYGGTVTLSSKVIRIDSQAPVAGAPISLYGRNKNSSTWREITRRTTSATGTVSVAYNPGVSTVFVWGYNGSPDLLGSRTGNLTVEVRPTITSNVSPATSKLGATTNFYGYVRPQHPGSPLYLQRLVGSTWTTITSTKLNSTGNYAFAIKPATRGTYTYRAVFQADADHATAVSPVRSFTVS